MAISYNKKSRFVRQVCIAGIRICRIHIISQDPDLPVTPIIYSLIITGSRAFTVVCVIFRSLINSFITRDFLEV